MALFNTQHHLSLFISPHPHTSLQPHRTLLQAVDIDEMLSQLGATALVPVTIGDDASNLEERFGRWTAQVLSLLSTTSASAASTTSGEEVSKRQAKKKARSQEVSLKKKNDVVQRIRTMWTADQSPQNT